MSAEPITPYACSRGLVIAHQDDPPAYHIRNAETGQVEGHPANGAPSPEAVESDLANPPAQPPAPLRQATDIVLDRLTDAEIDALTGPSAPIFARRAWLAATSTGLISESDPRFPQLTAALDAAGIIAAARWQTLLAP